MRSSFIHREPSFSRAIPLVTFTAMSIFVSLPPLLRTSASTTCKVNLVTRTSPNRLFQFHSGFWLNLHHFLYEQALKQTRAPQRGHGDAAIPDQPSDPLSESDKQVWASALDYYAKNLIKRDLLFDRGMVAINSSLAHAADAADLSSLQLDSDLRLTLQNAAPIYRRKWWPIHDSSNHKWVEAMEPLIKQMGPELADRLAGVYHVPWPADGIRVEVASYANWAGAYTVSDPNLITISSADDRNSGPSGLEILFHESSHILDSKVEEDIPKICKSNNLSEPKGLDHAIVFYTAGEAAKAALAKSGYASYVPYGVRYGLYDRAAHWKEYYQALQQYWQPYLDGKSDLDKALTGVVKAVAPRQ